MPTRQDIGGNINGQAISADLVTSWTSQSNSRTHQIINEGKLAALVQAHTPRVIYRMKGNAGIVDDDHAHEKHDPREFARVESILAPEGCYLSGGNEPGSASLAKLNNWTLQFVDECVKLHRKPVVFNNFVFHPTQGAAGWRIIKPAAQAALQAGGAIGVHIYFDVHVAQSHAAFRVLDDVHEVLGDVPIIVTEYGCAPGYDAFRGWQFAYGEDEYADELIAGVEQHGGANIDWLVYIYGLWAEARSYEITHAETVKRRITEFNRQMVEIDYGTRQPSGKVKLLRNASRVNFRETPMNGKVIAVLTGGEECAFWDRIGSNGWRKLEIDGKVGYASSEFVTFDGVVETNPPPIAIPLPEIDPSASERKNLALYLRYLANVIEFGVTSP